MGLMLALNAELNSISFLNTFELRGVQASSEGAALQGASCNR